MYSLRSRSLVRAGEELEGVVEETPAQMAVTNVFLKGDWRFVISTFTGSPIIKS
jgi:hypothetical protein